MTDAVIVSTARTPLCKSWRGALNMTHGATMGGHVVRLRWSAPSSIPPKKSKTSSWAARIPKARPAGTSRGRLRYAPACRSPSPGMTVNRFCSSGLQTVALAAQRILSGEGDIFVAGGVESISCVQNEMNKHMFQDDWLKGHKPEIYWPMLQTAETVAKRYKISREATRSLRRGQPAQGGQGPRRGRLKEEIAPISTTMKVVDKETKAESLREVTAADDEGIRADTTYEGVANIKPAIEGGVIAAGNASQFSDGAAAPGR